MKKTDDYNETIRVNILGTSDIHGRFMPWEYAPDRSQNLGSLTKVSTFVKEYRKSHDNIIIVDCGDSVQDNYVESLIGEKSNPMISGMNEIGYDTFVLGNHEFNYSADDRKKLIDEFNGKVLCGNIYNKDNSRYLDAVQIVNKGNIKIGIIGMTTPMIAHFEKGKDSLDGLIVKDAIEETKKAIYELQNKVDAIIGVMHMGEENENCIKGTGVIDVAKNCPELDVIIAGHMHLDVSSNKVNNVLITEPYKYAQRISEINLEFKQDESGFKLINKKSQTHEMKNVKSDEKLESKLIYFHNRLREKVNEPIGILTGENLRKEDEIRGISRVFTEPTAVMNLFFNVAKFYSKADVIALCTDNENAQIKKGKISIKDISNNYTYTGGEITVYEISGADLKLYMEWSAEYFNTLKEGDLTISYNPKRRNSKYSTNDFFSGVKYKIDLRECAGNRIKNLIFENNTSITYNTKLTIGMNSYRIAKLQEKGGIFYGKEFKKIYSSIEEFPCDKGTIRNLTVKYIKEELNGILKGDFTKNWEIIGINKDSYDYKLVKKLINDGIVNLVSSDDGKWTNIRSINKNDIKDYYKNKS